MINDIKNIKMKITFNNVPSSRNFHPREHSPINKINQVQLRIQNDLLEIKKNQMKTKMFESQLSDIIKDEKNEFFSLNVIFKEINKDTNFYHVRYILILLNKLLIIFDKDYPYSPPYIKLINSFGGIFLLHSSLHYFHVYAPTLSIYFLK